MVDTTPFEVTVVGTVTYGDGAREHRIHFNAYDAIRETCLTTGGVVDEASLMSDALRFIRDRQQLSTLSSVSRSGSWGSALRRLAGFD